MELDHSQYSLESSEYSLNFTAGKTSNAQWIMTPGVNA